MSYALIVLSFLTLFAVGIFAPEPAPPNPEPDPAPGSAVSTKIPERPAPGGRKYASGGSPPLRLVYPAAELDVEILPLTPSPQDRSSASIVPPVTMSAYWLTTYGKPGPGSVNTTYIVGHSWQDRDAPLNTLSYRAKAGDKLTLITAEASLAYSVVSVATEDKLVLKNSGIWDRIPGRLVVISSYKEDLWDKNILIDARPLGVP